MTFYKNKYIILVYDLDDFCVAVLDNEFDFAKRFDLKDSYAKTILLRFRKGLQKHFHYNGTMLAVHLIELEKNELNEIISDETRA